MAPGAVVRSADTQLQPDLLVYPARFSPNTDRRKIDEHWLAVEILIPSSRIYDRGFKRDAYFALGVQQVWLVDLALALRAEWAIARAGLTAFAEGRNLLDDRYSASAQVDNAAGRFYEPVDSRSIYAGVRWSR